MRYGLWTVSGETQKRGSHVYNLCTCDCGSQSWVRIHKLRAGKSAGCKKCSHRLLAKKYDDNKESALKQILTRIKNGARSRNIEFSVTDQYLTDLLRQQDYKCALSGLPITGSRREQGRQTISLDRIDSSKGYVEGNLQWVDKRVNMMKQSLSQAEFVELCRAVSQHDVTFKGA